MKFVARADDARSKSPEDIPLARRSSQYRRPGKRDVRIFVFIVIFIICLFFVAIARSPLLAPLNISSPITSNESLTSKDGRLLGHFPYPEASPEDLVAVFPGLKIHRDTYQALRSMRSAASAEGIELVLLSGYRSHDLQREIFFEIKSDRNQTAIERAKVSAPPGHSEHSTGYAIDLGDSTRRDTDFSVVFETTRAFQWLRRNAAKYHFILSFPEGNAQGVSYEPWHWRYEGTAEALREFEAARRFLEEL